MGAVAAYTECERLRPGWTNGELEKAKARLFHRSAPEEFGWVPQSTKFDRSLARLSSEAAGSEFKRRRLSVCGEEALARWVAASEVKRRRLTFYSEDCVD